MTLIEFENLTYGEMPEIVKCLSDDDLIRLFKDALMSFKLTKGFMHGAHAYAINDLLCLLADRLIYLDLLSYISLYDIMEIAFHVCQDQERYPEYPVYKVFKDNYYYDDDDDIVD